MATERVRFLTTATLDAEEARVEIDRTFTLAATDKHDSSQTLAASAADGTVEIWNASTDGVAVFDSLIVILDPDGDFDASSTEVTMPMKLTVDGVDIAIVLSNRFPFCLGSHQGGSGADPEQNIDGTIEAVAVRNTDTVNALKVRIVVKGAAS